MEYVQKQYPETLKVVNAINAIAKEENSNCKINYIKKGASIFLNGTRKIIIVKRAKKQSSIAYVISDEVKSSIEELLDSSSIQHDYVYGKIRIWLDFNSLQTNIEVHREIIKML